MSSNKSPDFDDIRLNVLKQLYGIIKDPLMCIFNFSFNGGVILQWLTRCLRLAQIFMWNGAQREGGGGGGGLISFFQEFYASVG